MNKPNGIKAILAAGLCTLLFGCSAAGLNVSELMRPPKATGDKAEIQQLIDAHANGDYTLKYPQNGSNKSAIIMHDLDSDSVEEAIAFYLPTGELSTVHMLVMQQTNSKWAVIGDHESTATAVDMIDFCDLDGDGKSEILTGWSTYNQLVNQLCVYLMDSGSTREIICDTPYSSILTGDFCKADGDELLLLSLHSADNPATASLLGLSSTKNTMSALGHAQIDPEVTAFAQLLTGSIFEGQFGAVIDGVTSVGEYNTQMLYFSEHFGTLERIAFSGDKPYNQATRSYAALSQDIDSDGIIEFATAFRLNTDPSLTESVPLAEVHWCEYRYDGTVIEKEQVAASFVYGFYFHIPDNWKGCFTACVNYSLGEVTFYEYKAPADTATSAPGTVSALGDKLLVLRMIPPDKWASGSYADFTKLDDNDSYVYAYCVPQSSSKLLLSDDEIQSAFRLS